MALSMASSKLGASSLPRAGVPPPVAKCLGSVRASLRLSPPTGVAPVSEPPGTAGRRWRWSPTVFRMSIDIDYLPISRAFMNMAFDAVGYGRVGLVGARRGDQVDHLGHDVDVGHLDVAGLGAGLDRVRVGRVVDEPGRRRSPSGPPTRARPCRRRCPTGPGRKGSRK